MGIGYDLTVTCCHTLAANNFVCAVIRTAVLEYLCLHGNLCRLQQRARLNQATDRTKKLRFGDTHLSGTSSLDCDARSCSAQLVPKDGMEPSVAFLNSRLRGGPSDLVRG